MGEANTQLDDLMDIVEVVSSTIDFERLYFSESYTAYVEPLGDR
ncbi:hypothetical protein [Halolamina sp.]